MLLAETMMMDRSLRIIMITIFGIGGLTIVLYSWLTPVPLNERITMTTFAGAGFVWAWWLRRF